MSGVLLLLVDWVCRGFLRSFDLRYLKMREITGLLLIGSKEGCRKSIQNKGTPCTRA